MEDVTEHGSRPTTTVDERAKIDKGEVRAIRISNVVNMILFAAKVFASVKWISGQRCVYPRFLHGSPIRFHFMVHVSLDETAQPISISNRQEQDAANL
ncbi:unnamed protein product [Calypogeia fissa]